jgi:uncharacterized protein
VLRVERTGATLAASERWASSALERMKGALNGPPLEPGEALVIPRARQVHTFGMSYPLDVIFCDDRWNVRHVVRMLQPKRITKWVWGSYYAIELSAGKAGDVISGDRISYSLSE